MCAGQPVVTKLRRGTSTPPPHTHTRAIFLAILGSLQHALGMLALHACVLHASPMSTHQQNPEPSATHASCASFKLKQAQSKQKSPHTRRNAAGSAQLRLVGSARHVHDCGVPAPWPLTFATVARTGLRWSWKLGLKPSVYLLRTK